MSNELLSVANTVGNISLPFVLWYLLQSQGKQNAELLNRLHDNHREQVQILTEVVKKNTEALAEIGVAFNHWSKYTRCGEELRKENRT